MAWALIVIAGVLETGFAVALKASEGLSRLVPSLLFLVFAAGSFTLLSIGLRTLPVGSAYAVWTGIGAVGTAVFGMVFLGESTQTLKLVSIALVVAGVVGLQLASSADH
ncbi:MAG: multidrug efflux SMR transporter [Actinobacteria bacterium]|nr:multidrug efflux SMR transporter [Actinomycetota bacterium]MBW3647556.1 multidrug efflux SMR transporter [Actinomycetota bacterium]